MNITDEYPLVPQYPFYGPRHILIWRVPGERHHAIVVDSETKLLEAFQSRYSWSNFSILEPKAYWKGTIVRSTPEMEQQYAEQEFKDERRLFTGWVLNLIRSFEELPHGFRHCQDYDPDPDIVDKGSEDEDSLRYMRDTHIGCLTCEGNKILPPEGVTWRDLFLHGRDTFRSSRGYIKLKGRIPDNAPKPNPDKPLLIAKETIGDQGRGFTFGSDLYEDPGAFMFCFQGEEHPIPQDILDQVSKWRAKRESRASLWRKERDLRSSEMKKRNRAFLNDLMAKLP